MTLFDERAKNDLLRAAAQRGSTRARELAEHARETYGTGPKARYRAGGTNTFDRSGSPTCYWNEAQVIEATEARARRNRERKGWSYTR